MIAIENEIDQFYDETEESVKIIIKGSDEHLDMILSITKPLTEISKKFDGLNNSLHKNINTYPKEHIKNILMPKLLALNKSCLTLIGAITTSFLYWDVKASLKDYSRQHSVLREIIHDVHHVVLADDIEFDNLLVEINNI